jgi:hypothetical protein
MGARQQNSHPPTVWFYIGLLLFAYGIIIFGAGIHQIHHPPPTVLANYNATLWAGIVLLILGALYISFFWPRRNK